MHGKKTKATGNTKYDLIINRDFIQCLRVEEWRIPNWMDVKWLYK